MLLTHSAPLFISGSVARPPEQLQIHHRVDDGVIAAPPRCKSAASFDEQLFQPLRRHTRSRAAPDRASNHFQARRVVIQESGIMIRLQFLPCSFEPHIPPTSGIFRGAFVHTVATARQSKSSPSRKYPLFLLLPFAGLVIPSVKNPGTALGFSAFSATRNDRLPRRRGGDRPLLAATQLPALQFCFVRNERVRWRRSLRRRLRKNLKYRGRSIRSASSSTAF